MRGRAKLRSWSVVRLCVGAFIFGGGGELRPFSQDGGVILPLTGLPSVQEIEKTIKGMQAEKAHPTARD